MTLTLSAPKDRQQSAARKLPTKAAQKKRIRLSELSDDTVGRIVALRNAGHSFREIGTELGLAHGSVMRVFKHKTDCQALDTSPALPGRPRLGSAALPDFARLAKLTAQGKTIKEVWREYAKSATRAYCYTHFSTLFRVWLEEEKTKALCVTRAASDGQPDQPAILDCTAEEDHLSELYWKDRIDPRSVIHVLNGHGSSVKVQRGDLVTFDGEERRFPKVTHGLKTLVLLSQSGNITLDSIKWCEAQSVGIFVLGWNGELIAVSQTASSTNIDLRRAQFRADRFRVAKAILTQKLQSGLRIGKLSRAAGCEAFDRMKNARTVDDLFPIEAKAALDYWSNWNFTLMHKKRNWPDQWSAFNYRASPISGGARHATHPVNAILNYAYSIAAAQITRTLQARGFDSAAGFLHADSNGRHSLAYDVLELLRADIDATILPWIASHTWKRPDFPVTPEGIVRLQPTLAAIVAQKAMLAQKVPDLAVEWLREIVTTRCQMTKC